MRDHFFYPAALIVLALMVFFAIRPGIGRLPDGPVTGDGVNYSVITIDGNNLNKIYAGGEAETRFAKDPEGNPAVFIRIETEALSEDPLLGPHYRLAGDLEVQYSGQIIRCTVRARPADEGGAMQMRVNYSAGRVGESGWQTFDLKPGYQDYTFEYRVPIARGDQGLDYFAIRPVVPDKSRSLWVKQITFTRLGRWSQEGDS